MICKKCNTDFPNTIVIDGKKYGLHNRKFCLICSPYKKHNTVDISKSIKTIINGKIYKACSICKHNFELSSENYYQRARGDFYPRCKSCVNKKTVETQRNIKQKCVEYLGGKCKLCGYSKCNASLDFHHTDQRKKLFNISDGKCYNFETLKIELNKCILICRNCHGEIHSGLVNA